jgi:methionyl aminopeptidase
MFFTTESMVNTGHYAVKVLSDGWTTVTKNKILSAQFKYTIGVTENGHEIFTRSLKGFDHPLL